MENKIEKVENKIIKGSSEWFNILAFQGGGVKGALSTTILERITKEEPDFLDKANLLCGTSTGSVIAAALAYGVPIEELASLYSYENCKYIFSPKRSPFFKPQYDNKNLIKLIDEYFPEDLTLNDLETFIVIITFALGTDKKSWKPVIYNNFPGSSTGKVKVRDAVISSCSAPIYFPSYEHNVDGAMVANDPSLVTLGYAMSYLGATLDNTSLLCIGTGTCEVVSIPDDTRNWGALEWIFGVGSNPNCVSYPLLDLAVSGNVFIAEDLVNALLKFRYLKINPVLEQSVKIDDYNAVPYLKEVGATYPLETEYDWIDLYWK